MYRQAVTCPYQDCIKNNLIPIQNQNRNISQALFNGCDMVVIWL